MGDAIEASLGTTTTPRRPAPTIINAGGTTGFAVAIPMGDAVGANRVSTASTIGIAAIATTGFSIASPTADATEASLGVVAICNGRYVNNHRQRHGKHDLDGLVPWQDWARRWLLSGSGGMASHARPPPCRVDWNPRSSSRGDGAVLPSNSSEGTAPPSLYCFELLPFLYCCQTSTHIQIQSNSQCSALRLQSCSASFTWYQSSKTPTRCQPLPPIPPLLLPFSLLLLSAT